MVMDVKWTYCGDHFVIHTNNKSLCCIPKTNILIITQLKIILKN